ncbi:lantibiotic dehydratase family protein [Dysgonomonas sp. GY617]|uniref:lantibiotic dehydratase family protein n=1 Tax=Dysgonomonas sp. GY617 TaxID=2780420 RepID=UPI0018832C05|nr:lantibiotic dehydratase family protein [Dysgonomonas sp. GY617]MBF0574773.1 lantibiotic dehydratase family protein [Dysgonomonas sp. GY617]
MNYSPFPQFIFRSPFLPFNHLEPILHDHDLFCQKLSDPKIQEAIYIASPVLSKELQKLLKGEIKAENERSKLIFSLERYISRMSTRCTPFGLFAGCSLGKIVDNEETNVELGDTLNRKTRLDMYYLCALYDALSEMPGIRDKIKYYPNTSLYSIGKKYRYVEYKYINTKKKYHISEIEKSIYLNKILKTARKGTNIRVLIACLVNDEITEEEAISFIQELIDSQIIVSELYQSVTGDDFFIRIIKSLETTECDENLFFLLKNIESLLKNIDSQSKKIGLYEEIISKINGIKIPYEEKFLFQVDMVRDASSAYLGTRILEELKSTMTFLNKITLTENNTLLSQFQQDFANRYEEKEVPLMEALDPELGIGYPSRGDNGDISPLADNFYLPRKIEQRGIQPTFIQSLLLKKVIECLSQKAQEIILTDEDVKDLAPNWDNLPPTIYTIFEIIRANKNDTLISLKAFSGSCGANLLARFAHIDSEIEKLVKDITKKDQELMPNVILAEIVHSPEARTGNILSRPHIREYELLYMANSDLPQDQLIYLSDLMLSVKQGRLIIRSKKLNKEIVPRLTTAHNYQNNSMPVYHFLSDMQMQIGRKGLFFDWGYLANELSFRPRVRYKNTILSPATWSVKKEEIQHLFILREDDVLVSEVELWRERYSIPRYVLMPDGDNELFIDWKSVVSIQSLFSIIKNRQIIKFEEFIFDSEEAVVKNRDDVYLNECIAAFHKNSKE